MKNTKTVSREPKQANSRRRGEALEDALLLAAKEELAAVGYTRLSMKGVAKRAKSSRSVLSRRWDSRVEMVLSVMRMDGSILSDDPPDTGSLREDTLVILRNFVERFHKIGKDVLLGILNDCLSGEVPAFDLPGKMHEASLSQMKTIIQRAKDRGEARPDIPEQILALPIDLTRTALLFDTGSVSGNFLTKLVDDIFLQLVSKKPEERKTRGQKEGIEVL